MPEPDADPNEVSVQRVAIHAVLAGLVITLLKFTAFALTNSVAILSDALESIINIVAAGVMLYSLWLSNRPADEDHPYGHGKVEFLAIGMEGWLILFAGIFIAVEAIRRLFSGVEPTHLNIGMWMLLVIGLLSASLAAYVWLMGRKYQSEPLVADGKHLATDVVSTIGVLIGLVMVRWSGWLWLDPVVAILVAGLCLFVSWRLLWKSIHGLMDASDPDDDKLIRQILDEAKAAGHILGYHKVRHRHNGPFHWVDMHLQVDGAMNVADSHSVASRIEARIEKELGRANATAHVEPHTKIDPVEAVAQASQPGESPPQTAAGNGQDGPSDTPIVRNDPL